MLYPAELRARLARVAQGDAPAHGLGSDTRPSYRLRSALARLAPCGTGDAGGNANGMQAARTAMRKAMVERILEEDSICGGHPEQI